jgi:multiple sugar transport system permease protein
MAVERAVAKRRTDQKVNLERRSIGEISMVALLFMVAIYFMLPIFWLLISITKDNGQLNTTFGLWFAEPSRLVENFQSIFVHQDGIFTKWFGNSFIYAIASAILSTMGAAMAGYAFSKYQFKGKELFFQVILGTIMIPSTALVLPLFLILTNVGLVNTAWGVILPQIVNPFGLYLMRIFWSESFPTELIEAARIDGASEWQIFWSMGLPLVRGGLTTVFLFSFVGSWNNFFLPLIVLNDTEKYPLILGLSVWNSVQTGNTPPYSLIILGALLSILPLIIAFLTLGRYWQGGLTTGATKG